MILKRISIAPEREPARLDRLPRPCMGHCSHCRGPVLAGDGWWGVVRYGTAHEEEQLLCEDCARALSMWLHGGVRP
jgi:hypothetical protein